MMKYDITIKLKDDIGSIVEFQFRSKDYQKQHKVLMILDPEKPNSLGRDYVEYVAICSFDEKRIVSFHASLCEELEENE